MKLVSALSTLLFCIFIHQAVAEEQEYIELRSGPAKSFPVIHITTQKSELKAITRQGNWFLMRHGLKEGWLDSEQLYLLDEFPQAKKWKLINETRSSQFRLESGVSTGSAFFFGAEVPLISTHRMYVRYTNGYKKYDTWSQLEAGIKKDLYRFNDRWRLLWSTGLGIGNSSENNVRWSTNQQKSVALLLGAVESVWVIDRSFEAGVRFSTSFALDTENSIHPDLSLFWNIRL